MSSRQVNVAGGHRRGAAPEAGPTVSSYCLVEGLDALNEKAWRSLPPPRAPGRREEATQVERAPAFRKTT